MTTTVYTQADLRATQMTLDIIDSGFDDFNTSTDPATLLAQATALGQVISRYWPRLVLRAYLHEGAVEVLIGRRIRTGSALDPFGPLTAAPVPLADLNMGGEPTGTIAAQMVAYSVLDIYQALPKIP